MKRTLRGALLVVLLILLVLGYKDLSFSSKQVKANQVDLLNIPENIIEHFQEAIKYKTVSLPGKIDTLEQQAFLAFLDKAFPFVDSLMKHDDINQFSRLYHWRGSNSKEDPILLLGHMDVVPVEDFQLEDWESPPFSGSKKDGFIYGRGSLDDKVNVIGILSAVELLLRQGFQPNRSVYFAFGHDEEIGGQNGAKAIASLLADQGLKFEYILDEGSIILEKALPGLKAPVALIGTAEKGYVTITLTAELEEGGHSSMPPETTAIGLLSEAITNLKRNPKELRLEGPARELLSFVGPEMSQPYRAVFANTWLTAPLIKKQFSSRPTTNALLRTTMAPTILTAGIKDNIMPTRAKAQLNFRILPGESIASTIEYVKKVVNNDLISVVESPASFNSNPSKVSPTKAFGFKVLQKTLAEIFPQVITSPCLVIAATDARHYESLSDQIYRFTPIQLSNPDLKRIHGINERIDWSGYSRLIQFYSRLLINSSK